MDPPSLPSDIKHKMFLAESPYFVFCRGPTFHVEFKYERKTNKYVPAPHPLSSAVKAKRNQKKPDHYWHFLNAKKCSITRIINGQDIFLPNFSSTPQADFYQGRVLISWLKWLLWLGLSVPRQRQRQSEIRKNTSGKSAMSKSSYPLNSLIQS